MICKRCGAEIPDWFIICGICGTPVYDKFRRKKNTAEEDPQRMLPAGRRPDPESSGPQDGRQDVYGQRIPYGQPDGGGPVISLAGARYCRISLILAVVSCMLIMVPFLPIPVSIMAIAFGVIGYRRSIHSRGRAIAGIAVGAAVLLISMTLSVCVTMLMPYMEDLNRMMESYLTIPGQ